MTFKIGDFKEHYIKVGNKFAEINCIQKFFIEFFQLLFHKLDFLKT